MVRNYLDQPLDDEVRDRLLAAALRAPSAGFTQGWGCLVLAQPQDRQTFWMTEGSGIAGQTEPDPVLAGPQRAPLVIVPFAHKQAYLDRCQEPDKVDYGLVEAQWRVPYWYVDAGMAALLMLLAAVDEGLGACFFDLDAGDAALRTAFGVPDGYSAVGALTVGHLAPDVRSPSLARGHRPVSEVVHLGRWSDRSPVAQRPALAAGPVRRPPAAAGRCPPILRL